MFLFYIHGLKEPNYITFNLATYGTLEKNRKGNSEQVTFKYPMVVHDHFAYRDAVDNHNGRRMFPIAIEEQLGTHRWIVRSFDFFVVLLEVNAHHARAND